MKQSVHRPTCNQALLMCTLIVTPWPEMFPNETVGNTPEVTPQTHTHTHTHTLIQLGPSDTTEAPETDCDRHDADETVLAVSHFSYCTYTQQHPSNSLAFLAHTLVRPNCIACMTCFHFY